MLRVKLRYLDQWSAARQKKAETYFSLFREAGLTESIELPFVRTDGRHIFHQFVIRTGDGRRDVLREHLRERNVGTDVYYPVPLHLQECFSYLGYQPNSLPVSEHAAHETLALPNYPELTHEQQEYVVNSIGEFFS